MGVVVESAFGGNLREGEFPTLGQSDGALNAKAKDELMRRYADRTPEEPREVEWADVRSPRQGEDRQVFADVRVNVAPVTSARRPRNSADAISESPGTRSVRRRF